MRILIVEDDVDVASMLQRTFAAEGYGVDVAHDGADGLWRAIEGRYSAIVLDLLLPELSGYKVCEQLRAQGCGTPILVLTAKNGVHDQLDLFEIGADDFVSKPVPGSIILARVAALVRRSTVTAPEPDPSGRGERTKLAYDEIRRCWDVDGRSVDLTARETAVLRVVQHAGDGFVSRQDVLDEVWGMDFDGDPSVIDVYLRRIRVKIDPIEIENRRGIGYRVRAP